MHKAYMGPSGQFHHVAQVAPVRNQSGGQGPMVVIKSECFRLEAGDAHDGRRASWKEHGCRQEDDVSKEAAITMVAPSFIDLYSYVTVFVLLFHQCVLLFHWF